MAWSILYAPSVSNLPVLPAAAALAISGVAPTLAVTANRIIPVPASALGITGYAPSVTQSGGTAGLAMVTQSLPRASAGRGYFAVLQAYKGQAPYTYSASGTYVSCDAYGRITGFIPAGVSSDTLAGNVTDVNGLSRSFSYTIPCDTASGTLAIASTALPNGTSGGSYQTKVSVTGGQPPYQLKIASQTGSTTFNYQAATYDLIIQATPTASGSNSLSLTVTDAKGNTASKTLTVTIDAVPRIAGGDYAATAGKLPDAMSGNKYYHAMRAWTSGTGGSWSVTGLPAGLSLSTAGVITGTPTGTGSSTPTFTYIDSSGTASFGFAMLVLPNMNVTRPSWNTGTGFFVLNGLLYDPNGAPFKWRGVDINHFDSGSAASITVSQANATRMFGSNFDGSTAISGYTDALNDEFAQNRPSMFTVSALNESGNPGTSGGSFTNVSQMAGLGASTYYMCHTQRSAFQGLGNNLLINVANEFGDSNSVNFKNCFALQSGTISSISGTTITLSDTSTTHPISTVAASLGYIALVNAGGVTADLYAIPTTGALGGSSGAWTVTLSSAITGYTSGGHVWAGVIGLYRGVGYTIPLVVDSGGSGQDELDLLNYGPAVANSDPLLNTILSIHIYGHWGNVEAPITGISQASSAVISFSYPTAFNGNLGAVNPFQNAFYYGPGSNCYITGVSGMTQINAAFPTINSDGGSGTAWTLTTNENSSGFSAYASGGFVYLGTHIRVTLSKIAALQAQGVCVLVGEFGPSCPPLTEGGSQTLLTASEVVRAAEDFGLGWCYWAWDDGTGSSNNENIGDYGCTGISQKGLYTNPSNTTYTGNDRIHNPYTGWWPLAQPASSFL